MMTLSLEFSSLQRSVALTRDDSVLCETVETGGRGTAAFSMIEKVLAASKTEREQIEMICVGLGPGSYTGIRAAISIAQGWQLALPIRLAGISSIEAIVAQAHAEQFLGKVCVAVDAQRNEFYLAVFETTQNGWKEIEPLKIVSPGEVRALATKDSILVGPGIIEWFTEGRNIFPAASHLGKMAASSNLDLPTEKLQPIYLRETTFVKANPIA
jgi:tRNA threonylcarbamoyladenosine biosynthesis protein TsaB